ncbi:zinc-binding dehydrogenase [Okeania sp. SIO1F9]|uniref:zinc-dependent alcohol dehydrogenase n=1 Tax=Okeania sp. SIO1F9 TaxID=2607813 RepID=UPI00144F49FE|nr:alcohol dehydrogenase catalytic domain-containing protein [Okeania sp. SIO1F9]NET75652.1 alcohol dehydrogenase catalytic domain-containing protein [Okeania sp. SIO1F9]
MNNLINKTATMQALVLWDLGKFEVREVPKPQVGSHEILLRSSAVGVCGSDFHIFSGESNFNKDKYGQPIPLLQQPQILGHEIVGVVEEVGVEVQDLSVGDRVVLDQGLNCLSKKGKSLYEYCLTGDSHQCEIYQEYGITGLPGAFAEYLTVPAVNAIKINSDLESVHAVLTEPLGCMIHSSDVVAKTRTRYKIGAEELERRVQSILILGAGPGGLLFTQYLRNILGYEGLILVSEPNARKRELVKSFGADVIDPQEVNIVEAVREKTNGRLVEYVIDACGNGLIFKSIPSLIRKQATFLMYGYGHGGVDLSVLNNLQFIETTLVCATGGSGKFNDQGRSLTYSQALRALEEKQIDVSSLITHRYHSLETIPQAFIHDHKLSDYIKGVMVL